MARAIVLFILVLLFVFPVQGQEKLTFKFSSAELEEVISRLEDITNYRFYYDKKWGEDITITVNIEQSDLETALSSTFGGVGISYVILDDNKIVLSKGFNIQTDFSEKYKDFVNKKKASQIDTITYRLPTKKEAIEKNISAEFQVYKIGTASGKTEGKQPRLSGYIKNQETGEPLVGAVVYNERTEKGTFTNAYGYYTFTLTKGDHRLTIQSMGMKNTIRNIQLLSDGKLDVELKSATTALKEVVVTEKRGDMVRNLRMGIEKLTMKDIKQMPMGFGEPDIIKSTLMLPGVQSVGEAASGFNVRGGSVDQNLILLNEVPILNTSHFFGFFSGFNSDVINDVTLYKSAIPARFGGRSSSVMDISMKDGNRKNTKLKGGISPVFARMTFETPIVKDKLSVIIGGRATYSDWVLRLLDDEKIKNSEANFYDVQGKITYDINNKNSIYLSAYKSYDKFDYYSEDAYDYSTLAATLKWKHVFSQKLFSTFSLGLSNYDYSLSSRADSSSMNEMKYKVDQNIFNTNFSYHPENDHKINFGLNSTFYRMEPGLRSPVGELSLFAEKELEHEQALEASVYISDEFDLGGRLSLSGGFRFTYYAFLGPNTENIYGEGQSKTVENIVGANEYGNKEIIKTYALPAFRVSVNYKTGENSSVKFGFDRMNQFIHMISNTAAMSPTDIWKLSDSYLKPQKSNQFSFGYYKNLRNNTLEFSVETYYKFLMNVLDYKGGAQLLMNDHLETDFLNGKGKAYGVEFMLKRKVGKLTGWVNYTYSRILHQLNSEFAEDDVNNGEYFPSNYDKPHEFKLASNFKVSRRLNMSLNFNYSTGRPYTAPVAYFKFHDAYRVDYSDRNTFRMDDYIRLDFAATVNGNLIKKKMNHSSLTFAVYNVLGRSNPYSIYFRSDGDKVSGYKMSIYDQPVFTLTYNFNIMGNAKDDF